MTILCPTFIFSRKRLNHTINQRIRSHTAFDCTAYQIASPKVHWQQWTDIDSLEVYNWSPSLCQQVEMVVEQAINQKTKLMKGEINKTQTNNTCISECPAWLLLIWFSCVHTVSSVHYMNLSGSHTSATVGGSHQTNRNKIQETCFVNVLVYH